MIDLFSVEAQLFLIILRLPIGVNFSGNELLCIENDQKFLQRIPDSAEFFDLIDDALIRLSLSWLLVCVNN